MVEVTFSFNQDFVTVKFLSDLKAGDRDIFVRRYWYMDNIKDIAKRHGCSETKIKSSLFRSRNKLWEEVKEII